MKKKDDKQIIANKSNDNDVRVISVLLSVYGVISFRSIPRIFELLCHHNFLNIYWIPHFTSVINWTLRLGLSLLNQVSSVNDPWLAIIDYSIDIGVKKALVVLRVPLNALEKRGKAIKLDDCECIGLKVHERTNGNIVADALTEIFNIAGDPVGIIKDNGSDLSKGVDLWRKNESKQKIVVIEDIGHIVANALKKQFSKLKTFEKFLNIMKKGASRLRQTSLAFLIPPKLRTKGRFQSISKLGDWAINILEILSKKELPNNDVAKQIRIAMPNFPVLRPFIESFAKNLKVSSQILKISKNKGFNRESYKQCIALLEDLPVRSKVRKIIFLWLKKHLQIHCRLGISQLPLLVSSDIIESLFGKFKHIIERSPFADMNKTTLLIPTLCGHLTYEKVTYLLYKTSHKDLIDWDKKNISYTMRKKRCDFFKGYQKTGIPLLD